MIKNTLDSVMERLVVPSFSSVGSCARSRMFQWEPLQSYTLNDKVVVLTGGTSGIGFAAAKLYASLGATLVLVGRNPEKLVHTVSRIRRTVVNCKIHQVAGDLGSLEDVRKVAAELAQRFPVIHVLAHNAGALYNERKRSATGTDLAVELMVSSPFLLTGLLLPQLTGQDAGLKREPSRVLSMSSGGMYTAALTDEGLQMTDENYNGARQYALAKRAQVVLNELWASRIDPGRTVFHALHPGWVDTPGINEALPGFSRILSPLRLLRKPEDGADTLVWLSVHPSPGESSGLFWHDRAVRPIDISAKTRSADTAARRQALWDWCERHTGWDLNE